MYIYMFYFQTDLILNAVKSLFQEQVKAIKDQKGSVSLYPKSIMDLVFSEVIIIYLVSVFYY